MSLGGKLCVNIFEELVFPLVQENAKGGGGGGRVRSVDATAGNGGMLLFWHMKVGQKLITLQSCWWKITLWNGRWELEKYDKKS